MLFRASLGGLALALTINKNQKVSAHSDYNTLSSKPWRHFYSADNFLYRVAISPCWFEPPSHPSDVSFTIRFSSCTSLLSLATAVNVYLSRVNNPIGIWKDVVARLLTWLYQEEAKAIHYLYVRQCHHVIRTFNGDNQIWIIWFGVGFWITSLRPPKKKCCFPHVKYNYWHLSTGQFVGLMGLLN
jgi:hypothetical protein